jgi:hypothetical protein
MMPLLPGVRRLDVTARDGRSLFYAVTSRGELMIYRQLWSDGKLIGEATSIDVTDSMKIIKVYRDLWTTERSPPYIDLCEGSSTS